MESFKQDYRLNEADLNYSFYNDEVAYPFSGLTYRYSPYWVRYEIGIRQESNSSYFPIGSIFRIPDEISTGIYRPNFIIGSDWNTGDYIIRWKYKKSAGSVIEYAEVAFKVVTEGIKDFSEEVIGGYLDLPADLRIVD